MRQKQFAALICGYGVPKDILTDINYNMYLAACFNTLFQKFRNMEGVVFFSGGYTDMFPPRRRTEANEMRRWFTTHMRTAKKASQSPLPWKIACDNQALTTVENILNFKKYVHSQHPLLVFCDQTRVNTVRKLARAVFPRQHIHVIPVDFDVSINRYRIDVIRKREQKDLCISLRALHDPKALKTKRDFTKRKLELMRQYPPEKAHEHLPEILEQLSRKFRMQKQSP